jgi:hypothetical protein
MLGSGNATGTTRTTASTPRSDRAMKPTEEETGSRSTATITRGRTGSRSPRQGRRRPHWPVPQLQTAQRSQWIPMQRVRLRVRRQTQHRRRRLQMGPLQTQMQMLLHASEAVTERQKQSARGAERAGRGVAEGSAAGSPVGATETRARGGARSRATRAVTGDAAATGSETASGSVSAGGPRSLRS